MPWRSRATGGLELAPNFHVYKLYGDFKILSLKDILVGYNLQEFVAEDGKLCAALVERQFDAKSHPGTFDEHGI